MYQPSTLYFERQNNNYFIFNLYIDFLNNYIFMLCPYCIILADLCTYNNVHKTFDALNIFNIQRTII